MVSYISFSSSKVIGESISGTECNDTDVQLIGGVGKDDGNVQICLDGLWGSVCGMEEWDYKAARVVCRQLMKDGCKLIIKC